MSPVRQESLDRGTFDQPTLVASGEAFYPDPMGGLYWPARKTLIVSDLHFEKGSSFARRGVVLPPYDTRKTISLVQQLCMRWQPECVIALGDSFHDADASARMGEEEAQGLMALTRVYDWIWICGNHDPLPPTEFGGSVAESVKLGDFVFCHEPSPLRLLSPSEVSGHFHPCAKVRTGGRSVRRRCFATDGRRIIMPALGAYTGGFNVLDPAYVDILGTSFTAWMMGARSVYPVRSDRLVPDA